MDILHIRLNGLSSLLMHNPASMIDTSERQTSLGRKSIPKPKAEADASRYVLPNGDLYVPAVAVRNCFLNACKGQTAKTETSRRAQAVMPFISAALLMIDEAFPLSRNGEPIHGDDYVMDARRAVIQRQGITRVRARIDLPWIVECAFGYNSEYAPVEMIKTIANRAGQVVGLLDYRIEKKGWFGRFEVADIGTGH